MSRHEYKDEYNDTLIVDVQKEGVLIVTAWGKQLGHAQPVLLTYDQAREVAVKLLEDLGDKGDV